MIELKIAAAAEMDYTESLNWYAERSRSAAERFRAEVARALQVIAADPERWQLFDDRHRGYLLRRFPYQVVFRKVANSRWTVVAIAHTSRRPRFWCDR